jgi:hypothetical protein
MSPPRALLVLVLIAGRSPRSTARSRRLPGRAPRPHAQPNSPPPRRHAARAGVRDALSQRAQIHLADRRRRRVSVLAAGADRPRPGRPRPPLDHPLSAHPHRLPLRRARTTPVPPTRAQARAPRALGSAEGRATIDVQPGRDACIPAHPEPQLVLARDGHRRRQRARMQDRRRRGAITSRREPPSPTRDDHPPGPLPPVLPTRAWAPDPIAALPGVRGRGRTSARAPLRADEGRPRPPGHDPTDPRTPRSHLAATAPEPATPAATSRPQEGHRDHLYDPGPADLYPMLHAENARHAASLNQTFQQLLRSDLLGRPSHAKAAASGSARSR